MNEREIDASLAPVAERIAALNRRAIPDPRHRAELRNTLMRRHAELRLARSRRGSFWLLRLAAVKRRGMLAIPALISAAVLSVFLWLLPISHPQGTQTAIAARLQVALARTAPTVTSWQWTVRTVRKGQPRVDRSGARLSRSQALYVAHGHTYLRSDGHWHVVVPPSWRETSPSPLIWQWAFAGLPARLATATHRSVSMLPVRQIRGHLAVGVVLARTSTGGEDVRATAWVDQASGLVLRLERVELRNGRMIERDVAEYSYGKRQG